MASPPPPKLMAKAGTLATGPSSIKTPRLLLSQTSQTYFEQILAGFTPKLTTYMGTGPVTDPDQIRNFIDRSIQQWDEGIGFTYVILLPFSEPDKKPEFLGVCSIHATAEGDTDFGVWVKESAHGNGYGREAVGALKEWAGRELDVGAVLYPVDWRNGPSRRLAEALGGVLVEGEKSIRHREGREDLQLIVYRIPV